MEVIKTHPVQTHCREKAELPVVVTMQAYEVYCHVHRPQEAMVTNGCRGGFGSGEIIAFLYEYPFPKKEWITRVNEAFNGMRGFA